MVMMNLSLTETGPLSTGLGKLRLLIESALYLAPVQETILPLAAGYDAEHRREIEHIVRSDGFLGTQDVAEHARAVRDLVEAVHRGAYAAGKQIFEIPGQRIFEIKRAKEARRRKQANDYAERVCIAYAVKHVTDRLGNPKKRDYKPGDKLPLSLTYAASIRDDVLKVLGRPNDAKKPSVTGIRRAIKRINDGVAFKD
jgi:hypothetical protein